VIYSQKAPSIVFGSADGCVTSTIDKRSLEGGGVTGRTHWHHNRKRRAAEMIKTHQMNGHAAVKFY